MAVTVQRFLEELRRTGGHAAVRFSIDISSVGRAPTMKAPKTARAMMEKRMMMAGYAEGKSDR